MNQLKQFPSRPPYLTIPEVASILRITRSTLYRLIKARQLATVRIGGRIFIPADEPENLIKRNTTPARRSFFRAHQ